MAKSKKNIVTKKIESPEETHLIVWKDTARISSRDVAAMFHKNHKHVLRDIENLDCSEGFNESNFGLVKYTDNKGEKRPEYLLTKDGFTFLTMGYRGEKAAQFKEAYINAFNKMEKQLAERHTDEWQLIRAEGKYYRGMATDAIQMFVDYAEAQGSKHADKYYLIYSKLVKDITGYESRDDCDKSKLADIMMYEIEMRHIILDGMAQNLHYKVIYQQVKVKLHAMRDILRRENELVRAAKLKRQEQKKLEGTAV